MDIVRLTLPGSPEYLRLARLATADVAARAGFDYEQVEDLRTAVDELAFALLKCTPPTLTLEYELQESELEIRGRTAPNGAREAPELGSLAQAIVGAVLDRSELGARDGAAYFVLGKKLRVQ
jgi:serine/threonine-protein kinase RsbW